MKRKLWLALAPMLAGCATIVEGTDQTVTVITDPAGAECELQRQGSVIAIVNPTPGSVTVDKSQNNITVRCRLEGHEDGVGTFDSEFQGMTAGNILFGGVVGVGAVGGMPADDCQRNAMVDYIYALIFGIAFVIAGLVLVQLGGTAGETAVRTGPKAREARARLARWRSAPGRGGWRSSSSSTCSATSSRPTSTAR